VENISVRKNSDRIRTVILGSNFTVRIFCQVRFCRCKISGLELVFSVVDLDLRAVYQLIGVELYLSRDLHLYREPWRGVVYENIQLQGLGRGYNSIKFQVS